MLADSSIYLNWLLENIYNKVPNSNSGKKLWIILIEYNLCECKNIPLHYVVNLFFWRFVVIFLPDFISDCVYTANLENHCIYIRVELQRNQSFRYFVTGIEFWV